MTMNPLFLIGLTYRVMTKRLAAAWDTGADEHDAGLLFHAQLQVHLILERSLPLRDELPGYDIGSLPMR